MKFLTGTLLCSTILFLTGCSSSSTTPTATAAAATALTSIDGTWQSACTVIEIDGGEFSFQVTLTADDGNSEVTEALYNGSKCKGDNVNPDGTEPENETYTLGDVVTVDGSVASITSATKIDLTDEDGVTSYSIVAISGNNLYIGDDEEEDSIGETEENRPEQLANFALVKQ
jgi:hypothetical protein